MIIKYMYIIQSAAIARSTITEQNPEHLINRKIQPTEDLNTDTRFFFYWPALLRTSPSASLRIPADLVLLDSVDTHCSFH